MVNAVAGSAIENLGKQNYVRVYLYDSVCIVTGLRVKGVTKKWPAYVLDCSCKNIY